MTDCAAAGHSNSPVAKLGSLPQSVFLIVSVVEPGERSLSYTSHRSIYSPCERLEQTLQTVASIRTHVPGARTIVLELGRRDVAGELAAGVDEYHYLGRNRLVRRAVDGPMKGLGEAVGLLVFLLRSRPFAGSRFVFKLSGRYRLAETFAPERWDPDHFNFHSREGGLLTRLYGLPAAYRWSWVRLLIGSVPGLLRGESIEAVFARRLRRAEDVRLLAPIGVEGEAAENRDFISE